MHGLDVDQVSDPGGVLGPAQEVPHGSKVRLPRVAVADLGSEELDEALLGGWDHPWAMQRRRHLVTGDDAVLERYNRDLDAICSPSLCFLMVKIRRRLSPSLRKAARRLSQRLDLSTDR